MYQQSTLRGSAKPSIPRSLIHPPYISSDPTDPSLLPSPTTMPQTRLQRKRRKLNEDQEAAYVPNWLDALPDDVCYQIASHIALIKNEKCIPLQRLALVSEKQRRAVVACLDGIFVDQYDAWLAPIWRKTFIDAGVRYVVAGRRRASNGLIALLQERTLRRVMITDHPTLLHAVASSPSIVAMILILRYSRSPQLILDTFATLKLDNLFIICDSKPTDGFCIASRVNLTPALLAPRCPHLTHIEVYCKCNASPDFNSIYVSGIPSLRRASVRKTPPAHLIRHLSSFDSVKLSLSRPSLDDILLARHFSTNLTALRLKRTRLNAKQLRSFPAFPKLASLKVGVESGAEEELIEICRRSPLLTALRLEWKSPDYDMNWERKYVDAVKGTVLRIVKGAPALEHLSLYYVRISALEIQAILRSMGPRLSLFRTSMLLQEEDTLDRLLTIVETVIEHNHNIRELGTDNELIWPGLWEQQIDGKRLQVIALLRHLRKREPKIQFHIPACLVNQIF